MSLPPLETLRSTGVVFVDDARVRISIMGEDRFTWLNGVVTCDVKPMIDDAGKTRRAAYGCALNVKGRVLADVIVVSGEGELGAWVPRSAVEGVLELWRKYVIMEDCELAIDEGRTLVSIEGAKAQSMVDEAGIAERAARFDRFGIGGGFVVEMHNVDNPSTPQSILDSIVQICKKHGGSLLDSKSMHDLLVESARATWGVDLDAHAYVQEARIEDRAVSFTKGCYVGQEVVCMLQMRGKVHRRLVQLAVDRAPDVGAEVAHAGEVVGHVTSVAAHDDGSATALAMLKSSANVGEDVDIGGARARVVTDAR
jgi:folate-binding protein YgfZ